MGKISTYGFDSSVTLSDFVIGTDADDSNITKSYLIGDILSLAPDVTWGSITGTLSDQADLQSALNAKQDTLVSGTNIKTVNSTTLLGSGNLNVQDVLISGTNIKTINGNSILGSGNLSVPGESYVYQVGSVNQNNIFSVTQNTPLQISLGPAISNTNVDVDAGGNVQFLTTGKYLVKIFLNAGRDGAVSGTTLLSWRAMLNSSMYGEPRAITLDTISSIKNEEIDFFIDAVAGDRFAIVIVNDMNGVNDACGIYQKAIYQLEVPASSVQIWKNE